MHELPSVKSKTHADFWKWLGEYAVTCAKNNRFGFIHPSEFRKKAAATFGLKSLPEIWAWQTAHEAKIRQTINRAAKPLGLRLNKLNGPGRYAQLVPITKQT